MRTCHTQKMPGAAYPTAIHYYIDVLNTCLTNISLPAHSSAYTALGRGSYGEVWGVAAHYKRRKINMAIKIIYFKDHNEVLKHESRVEADYAEKMAAAGVGPKVYQSIYLVAPGENRAIIIIMHRGQEDGFQYLASTRRSNASKMKMLREMMKQIHKMVSKGMYCYDIKPANFIVNAHRKPKIIDFGGQFCSIQRYEAMTHMRENARQILHHLEGPVTKELEPELRVIADMPSAHYKNFTDAVFYTLIMIPFISLVRDLGPTAQPLLVVFHAFAKRLCFNRGVQTACILILIYDHNIWQTFAHYLRHPTPAGDLKKHNAAERGQFFDTMLQKLCMEISEVPEYTREKKKSLRSAVRSQSVHSHRKSGRRRKSRRKSRRKRKRRRGAVGFAAGAATGALVGGPVGAVLGGVIGGITGRHSTKKRGGHNPTSGQHVSEASPQVDNRPLYRIYARWSGLGHGEARLQITGDFTIEQLLEILSKDFDLAYTGDWNDYKVKYQAGVFPAGSLMAEGEIPHDTMIQNVSSTPDVPLSIDFKMSAA